MRVLAILLVCLLAFSANASIRQKMRNKQVASAQAKAREAAFRSWMSYDYNYDYANTIDAAAKKSTGCSAFDSKPYLAVRTNKFEAAMSLAVQNNPAMVAVLKEMIQRELCVARIAFPDGGSVNENFRRQHVFALPGSTQGAAELAWVANFATAPARDQWGKTWINLDNSRSGMWVTNDLTVNLAYLNNLITSAQSTGWRELLHTLTRAALYGEDLTDRAQLATQAPYSLRHAIYVVLNDRVKKAAAESQCGFTEIAGKTTLVHKKTYFGNYALSSVAKARLKDKPFRGFSAKKNTHIVGNPYYQTRMTVDPNAVGCDAFPTQLTPNALVALNMPPISQRELYYFSNFYHMKDNDLPRQAKWTPTTGADPVPWGYGACVWDMDSSKFAWNKEWVDAMNGDGLAVDAGPSGTTDEILSAGDWMGITSNAYGFCALRDVAIALMPIAEHHSLGEVLQGAYDGVRAVGAGLKDFKFADPWASIHWCDNAANDFTTKFVQTGGQNKLPASVSRFQTALSISALADTAAPWTTIQTATDYAAEPVPHKFRDADVAVSSADWSKFCGCVVGTTPFSGVGMSADQCVAASNSMAVGCGGYGRHQLGACGGNGVGSWGTATAITWPTTAWTHQNAFRFA